MSQTYTETEYPAPDTPDEIIKTRLYEAGSKSEVIVLVTGYYMGPRTMDGLATLLHQAGYTVAIISNYGAPTWIDPTINFSEEVPELVRAWTSAARHNLLKLHEQFEDRTFHLIGYSLGGPAALLAAAHTDHQYRTLTLVASIGIQGPTESLALRAMKNTFTRPFVYLMSRLALLAQVARIRIEYNYFRRAPRHRSKYQPIAEDKAEMGAQGANKIGYQVGVAKLTFYIGRFIELVQNDDTRLCLIGHKSDAYISANALKSVGTELNIPVAITPGTHDHVKTDPEDIAPIILRHIQASN